MSLMDNMSLSCLRRFIQGQKEIINKSYDYFSFRNFILPLKSFYSVCNKIYHQETRIKKGCEDLHASYKKKFL